MTQRTWIIRVLFLLVLQTTLHAQPPLPDRPQGSPRFTLPTGVKIIKDLPYAGTSNPRQTLDLLIPEKHVTDDPLPVIVAIHGGAFRMGDKSMGLRDIADVVASGHYAGATVNYRLSGEAIWPAQIHDCKAAVRWIRGNATRYHLDPERIGVIGASAGGHLAATLGTSGSGHELEGSLGNHILQSSRVQAVVDQFGPSELLTMAEYQKGRTANEPNSPESQLIGGPIQDNPEKARTASPISYVSSDDPPFLIFHGTEDPLVPFNQSERLAQALKNANVDVTFVPVTGAGHGGFRNPEVTHRIRMFWDKHLRRDLSISISTQPIPNRPPNE